MSIPQENPVEVQQNLKLESLEKMIENLEKIFNEQQSFESIQQIHYLY